MSFVGNFFYVIYLIYDRYMNWDVISHAYDRYMTCKNFLQVPDEAPLSPQACDNRCPTDGTEWGSTPWPGWLRPRDCARHRKLHLILYSISMPVWFFIFMYGPSCSSPTLQWHQFERSARNGFWWFLYDMDQDISVCRTFAHCRFWTNGTVLD